MRSFTAMTEHGLVRAQFPDDDTPRLMLNGRQILAAVPTETVHDTGPALDFDGTLVVPQGQRETRQALTITRGDVTLEDVEIVHAHAWVRVPGWPVLFASKLRESRGLVTGWTFTEDGPQQETWEVDLVPMPRRCCGGGRR